MICMYSLPLPNHPVAPPLAPYEIRAFQSMLPFSSNLRSYARKKRLLDVIHQGACL